MDIESPLLSVEKLQVWADAVRQRGSPLDNFLGFIDETLVLVCRPIQYQEIIYNGYKRTHGIKFQSIMLPIGMIGHLFGPVKGRKHDASILIDSGILLYMENHMLDGQDRPFYLYEGSAYPLARALDTPISRQLKGTYRRKLGSKYNKMKYR